MSFTFDLEPEFLKLYDECREETMTSLERMYALYNAVRHLAATKVPGDLVECGVWRGGSVMLMAKTLTQLAETDRNLWLYDTFEGMTPPSVHDVQEMSGRTAGEILGEREATEADPFWGVAPRTLVEANLARTGYPMDRIRFIEGDVRVTIPSQMPQRIALLRLDTDWYESTRHELEQLYPRVVEGGVLIVDDYGYWRGARKATDEFFATLKKRPLLSRIDFTGRIAVKL